MSYPLADKPTPVNMRRMLRMLMSWLVVLGMLCGYGLSDVEAQAPPTLALDLDEQYAVPRDKVTFKVVEQGGQNLSRKRDYTFAWSFDGQPVGRDDVKLEIKRVEHEDEGIYTVEVTHLPSQSVQVLQGMLHVQEEPKITREPEDWEVIAGDCVIYSVEATGDALRYEWTKDGQVVSTQDHWIIDAVDQSHKGNVKVKVFNDADTKGDKANGKIRLKNNRPPSSALGNAANDLYIMPEYQETAIGNQAMIELLKYGGTPPTAPPWSYLWWRPDGARLGDQTSLTIPSVDPLDAGVYYNVISRKRGKSADSECRRAVIDVYEAPFILQAPADTQVMEGDDITFDIDATGTDLEYEWSLNGQLVSMTSSWTLTGAALTDAGTVSIRVFSRFDPIGIETSFDLDVYPFIPDGPELVPLTTPEYVATGTTWSITAQTVHNYEPYTWEWLDPQGNTISTSATLTLASVSMNEAGLYSVRVTGQNSGEFDDAQVEFIVQDPITILDVQGALIAPEDTAVLSVSVTGTDPIFTWERQGQLVGTGPQLILSNAQLSDAGTYDVFISNAVTAPPVTAQATLRVLEPVSLDVPPSDATVATGSALTLDVQASGSELQYEWRAPSGQIISSSASLSLVNLLPTDSGAYTIKVFNDLDVTGVTATAQVTVLDPPVITQGPADITVTEGDAFTAQVTATGGTLDYRWELAGQVVSTQPTWSMSSASLAQQGEVTVTVSNAVDTAGQSATFTLTVEPDIPEGPSITPITSPRHVARGGGLTLTASIPQTYEPYSWSWRDAQGQTLSSSPTLTLSNLTASVTYTVEVTGDISGLSDTASVQVIVQEPAVITEASGAVGATGGSVTLTVSATGDALTYAWSKAGQQVGSSASLTLSNLSGADAGDYTITVSNAVTQPGDSRTVTVEVLDLPVITTPPADQIVATGSSASFFVDAAGDQLVYAWTKDGQTLSATSTLSLNSVSKADAGSYSVQVTNPVDQAGQSASATLTVLDPPVITSQPQADIQIAAGQGFSLQVVATGDALSYQWQRDGADIPSSISSVYNVSGAQSNQSGSYTVRVSNAVGEQVSSAATVLVEEVELVSITGQPADATVEPGEAVTFEVVAAGDELTYQWLRDGQEIAGATSASYGLTVSLADDGALFSARVTNRYSEETSQTALLTVRDDTPPTITVNNVGVAFTFDDTLTLTGTVQDNVTAPDAVEVLAKSDQLPGVELTDFASGAGQFSMTLPLEVGVNVLTLRARDEAGNVSDAVVVTIERRVAVEPTITITQPNRDIQTQSDTLDVRGEVITSLDASGLSVTVNGQAVTLVADGQDRYTFEMLGVTLEVGSNLVEAVVSSAQGTSRDQVVVERLTGGGGEDPTLTLTLGATRSELWLSEPTYNLTGQADANDCVVDVRVNGVTPTQQDGVFTPTVTFSTMLTVPVTDGSPFPVQVVATGCSGQTVTRELTLRVDLEEPVIVFDGVSTSGVNVVVSNPYRLTGRIIESSIAGAMLGGQPLALVPGAVEGEWSFAVDVALERAVEREVVITAWDLGGNRSEGSVSLRLDTAVSVRAVMPGDGEQVVVDGERGPVRFKVAAEQVNGTDRVELRTDEGSFIPLTKVDEFYELELELDADASYTAEIRVVDAQGSVLATTQTSFEVLDREDIPVEVVAIQPTPNLRNVDTIEPVILHFNLAMDASQLEIQVLETVHDYSYRRSENNRDLRNMSTVDRVLVSHERQPITGVVQGLPGGRTFAFYPDREWSYGGEVLVEVIYKGQSIERSNFYVRQLPTLVHGFVTSTEGDLLEGVKVELVDLGYETTTDRQGSFNFGWGWPVDRQISPGRHRLRINGDQGVASLGSYESWVVILGSQINALGTRALPYITTKQPDLVLTPGQANSFVEDALILDIPSTAQIFYASGQVAPPVRAAVRRFDEMGYPINWITFEGFGFSFSPGGITVTEPVDVTCTLPFVDGERDYTDLMIQTDEIEPALWILGLDDDTLSFKPVGVGRVSLTTFTVESVEPVTFDRLDGIVFAFVMPTQAQRVDQYMSGAITLDVLIQSIEAQP